MFLDDSVFPFLPAVRDARPDIRAECVALGDTSFEPWVQREMYGTGWTVYGLVAFGQPIEDALGSVGTGLRRVAAQNPLEGDRDESAEYRTDQLDPVVGEVPGDQHRREGPDRVHRCAGDRSSPDRYQADVAPDGQGAVDADVTGAGGGAEVPAVPRGCRCRGRRDGASIFIFVVVSRGSSGSTATAGPTAAEEVILNR